MAGGTEKLTMTSKHKRGMQFNEKVKKCTFKFPSAVLDDAHSYSYCWASAERWKKRVSHSLSHLIR